MILSRAIQAQSRSRQGKSDREEPQNYKCEINGTCDSQSHKQLAARFEQKMQLEARKHVSRISILSPCRVLEVLLKPRQFSRSESLLYNREAKISENARREDIPD